MPRYILYVPNFRKQDEQTRKIPDPPVTFTCRPFLVCAKPQRQPSIWVLCGSLLCMFAHNCIQTVPRRFAFLLLKALTRIENNS